MATITEDYVSFEVAKLLKEKRFDIECDNAYHNGILTDYTLFGFCTSGEFIYAPTLQTAMKWLREEHNIDVSIIPLRSHKEYLPRIESDTISHDAIPCRKYEEACEIAIKYCLENLI